ncbi:unnamed protein product [Zymoseptoria tritici ST99CH_1A5]|uniref:Heme haloperoxidase family profile domain-containing protein n=4 Tax=Zymoseptoria tritici TaxID=1047171 RepID=A0A1X7RGJ9_ZYMT9|nr:unnamed protein product [Zymoseptoria tritici ST99CH_3D7]SMR42907.1 unnamed protein product [Zymoseptoria tritici ST99CH_1E4]SMR45077.1 unnamed protein product [Zymoseptoria tritici ST99CH_3D1]SMY20242.1 unnamed protein product [Zymoseptoria tritici ST99CH_1A5]
MVRTWTAVSLFAAAASAQLNIPSLLFGLGPAPDSDVRWQDWRKPGPNDVRSPCPGLNALANHNFIHRDGRNMTIPHLVKGLAAGLNVGPDFTIAIGGVGLFSSPNPLGGSFDLNDLDQHNFPIEHDASLSRKDAFFGNDYSYYDPFFQDVISFFPSGKTDIPGAAKAIANRTDDSEATNPEFVYGAREFILRYGETSLYLQTMGGSDTDGVANVDYVRSLFEKERLPYALGWRPRKEPITLNSLGLMIFELFGANPNAAPEGVRITQDSYKNLFQVLAGGSNALNNVTQGLAAAVGL